MITLGSAHGTTISARATPRQAKLAVQQQRGREAEQELQRHARDHPDQRIAQALPEHRVGQCDRVICQTDERAERGRNSTTSCSDIQRFPRPAASTSSTVAASAGASSNHGALADCAKS